MIIDKENLARASSYSSNMSKVEMELEDIIPELEGFKGQYVMFAVNMCDNLIIAYGVLKSYEEVTPDPRVSPDEQVLVRLELEGQTITISF